MFNNLPRLLISGLIVYIFITLGIFIFKIRNHTENLIGIIIAMTTALVIFATIFSIDRLVFWGS